VLKTLEPKRSFLKDPRTGKREYLRNGVISEVKEIQILRLIVVGSADKKITVWKYHKEQIVLTIDCPTGGVHSICYFETYQILISAGFENKIRLYSINPEFYDAISVGRLVGH
jgi:WD40 repeat protein